MIGKVHILQDSSIDWTGEEGEEVKDGCLVPGQG